MKRYIITALCAFVVCWAWGQLNAPCFTIDIPENTPALYNNIPLTIDEDSTVIELDDTPIYALAVTGQVEMHTANNSMARIILVDNYGTEYLVYEVNSLLTDTNMVSFENVGRETLWQDMIFASHLVVRLTNATVTMNIPTLVTELLEQSSPTIKRARTMAQNDTIVNVLNRNLAARDIPWRAGRTEISDLEYTDRKLLLGNNCPLHNIEYYTAGYYVDPTVEEAQSPAVDDGYVKNFDWRNRHSKNWMTPSRNQGGCGSCWAFAAVGVSEAYINLYYNNLYNSDLSEQDILSCSNGGNCDDGGYVSNALRYISNNGVIGEKDWSYSATDEICENKPTEPLENILIENFVYIPITKNNLKQNLYYSPITIGFSSWWHILTLVGYKIFDENDYAYYINSQDNTEQVIPSDSTYKFIGETAWIVKNSWGKNWGENGFGYVISNINNMHSCYKPYGKIISLNQSDSDIVCSDADNDGYYFWGIGDKPAHCPVWASDIPDGDDSDPMYGAMDEYGHLDSIGPAFKEPKTIVTNTTWSTPQVIPSDLIIPSGVTLTVTSYLTMHPDATITIEGGQLIVDGGTIRNGDINNKGSLVVKNNGIIEMCDDDQYRHNTKDIVHISNFKSPFNKFTQIKNGGFKRVNR